MVSSIGGAGNVLSSLYTQLVQAKQGPEDKLKKLDTDGDGSLIADELARVAADIGARSGQTLNVEEAITTYDTDGDSMLNQSEMDSMMQKVMEEFSSPAGGDSSSLVLQALSAYQENQDDDQLTNLLEQLSTRAMPGPPPDPEAKFNELDSDGDGGLNIEELDVMAEEISSKTGLSLNSEEMLASYDTNEDGVVDMDEMESMMADLRDQLGPPPNMKEGGSMADALVAYLEESDDDTVGLILEILGNYSNNQAENTKTGVNIAV